MDGVYMVNVYDRDPDGEGETNNVRTLISYNKGALWRQLTPPTVDSRGKPILCQPVSNAPSPPAYSVGGYNPLIRTLSPLIGGGPHQ